MRKWRKPEFIERWDDEEYWMDVADIIAKCGPWLLIVECIALVVSGFLRGCA